jgi:hypothetical protein
MFGAEAAARLGFLCQDFGFLGPELNTHGDEYPMVVSLRYHGERCWSR